MDINVTLKLHIQKTTIKFLLVLGGIGVTAFLLNLILFAPTHFAHFNCNNPVVFIATTAVAYLTFCVLWFLLSRYTKKPKSFIFHPITIAAGVTIFMLVAVTLNYFRHWDPTVPLEFSLLFRQLTMTLVPIPVMLFVFGFIRSLISKSQKFNITK